VHYSATELKPCAQNILRNHRARFLHLFDNVLDRLPVDERRVMEDMVKTRIREFSEHQARCVAAMMSDSELQEIKHSLGASLLQDLSARLELIEFEETAHCLVHDGPCPVSPRFVDEFQKFWWCEAAGNTCCPWSQMSLAGGCWLDSATLPFLVPGRRKVETHNHSVQ
jgi:hypothetical protein